MRGVSEEVVVAGGSVELCDLAIDVFVARVALRLLYDLCHCRFDTRAVSSPADALGRDRVPASDRGSVASADPENWVMGS